MSSSIFSDLSSLPVSIDDILVNVSDLTDTDINLQTAAKTATLATIKGLEYAMGSLSMLSSDELKDNYQSLCIALAGFELWRHYANIIDDIVDDELYKSEYLSFFDTSVTQNDLFVFASCYLAIASRVFTDVFNLQVRRGLANASSKSIDFIPEILTRYKRINKFREQRAIMDLEGNSFESYWENHAGVVTGLFYQLPFSLVGGFSREPDIVVSIEELGYCFGQVLHAKNDLEDLSEDIINGDFSWPVIYAVQSGDIPYELLRSRDKTEQNIGSIMDVLKAGPIQKFYEEIDARMTSLTRSISLIKASGRSCNLMEYVIDYVQEKIKNIYPSEILT